MVDRDSSRVKLLIAFRLRLMGVCEDVRELEGRSSPCQDLPPLSPPKIGGNNLTISKMGGKQCAQLWDPLQAKALTPSAPAPTAGAYGASTGAGFVVDPTRALCSSFEKVSRPSEQS